MSAWRRKAVELFPERRSDIERARSVYEVLASLGYELRRGFQAGAPDAALVDRAFAFAAWCWAPEHDWALRNAVAVGFYEHVPAYGADARRELVARLSAHDLAALRPLFRQMLERSVYEALEAEIARVHGSAAGLDAQAI